MKSASISDQLALNELAQWQCFHVELQDKIKFKCWNFILLLMYTVLWKKAFLFEL